MRCFAVCQGVARFRVWRAHPIPSALACCLASAALLLLQAVGGVAPIFIITAPQLVLAVIATRRRSLWRSPLAAAPGQ
jgi:hypothetical protein